MAHHYVLVLLPFIGALLLGFIPILFWLWFWEHEDKNPEPKKLTFYAILAGALAVVLVIPFEKIVLDAYGNSGTTIFLWAALEESFKFILAYVIVLRRKENDEPIDNFMYMMATALGFAALENTLFILPFFSNHQIILALSVANFRFMGATLLHVISSGTIGIFLALAYYKKPAIKGFFLVSGLITAILLHSLFNLGIVVSDATNAIIPFFAVWLGSIVIIFSLEKVKRLKKLSSIK